MENIDILNAELDLIEAAQKQNVELLTKDLDNILNHYFVTPVESVVARRFIQHGCWSRDVEFYFEVGFYNPEENRIDFGSDTSFEYDSKKRELSVNHGCCGSFTKKNIYQFKRAMLIAEVYKNIDDIENAFQKLAEKCSNLLYENDRRSADIEYKVKELELAEREKKRKEVIDSIKVNDTLMYIPDCKCWHSSRLFRTKVTVTKITPKYVVINDGYNNKRLDKNFVANHILEGYIEVNETV